MISIDLKDDGNFRIHLATPFLGFWGGESEFEVSFKPEANVSH